MSRNANFVHAPSPQLLDNPLTINNVSRIEVTSGPTPETRADAIGGTVNLVSRSTLERIRPEFTFRAYLSMNHQHQHDVNLVSLRETSGTTREPSTKPRPSFEFSFLFLLYKDFGFTVTGMNSHIYNRQYRSANRWTPSSNVGTLGTIATLANPAMTSHVLIDGPTITSR